MCSGVTDLVRLLIFMELLELLLPHYPRLLVRGDDAQRRLVAVRDIERRLVHWRARRNGYCDTHAYLTRVPFTCA